MERVRADSLGQLRHNVNNLTRAFIFVVYPSMVTFKENLSTIFFSIRLIWGKSALKFEMHISLIQELLITLQSPAAQAFSNFFKYLNK